MGNHDDNELRRTVWMMNLLSEPNIICTYPIHIRSQHIHRQVHSKCFTRFIQYIRILRRSHNRASKTQSTAATQKSHSKDERNTDARILSALICKNYILCVKYIHPYNHKFVVDSSTKRNNFGKNFFSYSFCWNWWRVSMGGKCLKVIFLYFPQKYSVWLVDYYRLFYSF